MLTQKYLSFRLFGSIPIAKTALRPFRFYYILQYKFSFYKFWSKFCISIIGQTKAMATTKTYFPYGCIQVGTSNPFSQLSEKYVLFLRSFSFCQRCVMQPNTLLWSGIHMTTLLTDPKISSNIQTTRVSTYSDNQFTSYCNLNEFFSFLKNV